MSTQCAAGAATDETTALLFDLVVLFLAARVPASVVTRINVAITDALSPRSFVKVEEIAEPGLPARSAFVEGLSRSVLDRHHRVALQTGAAELTMAPLGDTPLRFGRS